MVTYTFTPKSTTQMVFWHDPSIWVGGVVPNGAAADVVLPTTPLAAGGLYISSVTVSSDETYSVGSLDIANQILELDGKLSVLGAIAIGTGASIHLGGGTLIAGSLFNEGAGISFAGELSVAGLLSNSSRILGMGLTMTAARLINSGTLEAGPGNLIVNVPAAAFLHFEGGSLTGGTYAAADGTLFLNVGGVIASTATTITLNKGGAIASFDPVSGMYLPLQETLNFIAPSGALSLSGQSYDWGELSIDGVLALYNAALTSDQLTVGPTGQITGGGTISAPVFNSGLIVASGGLDIEGPVTGPGRLVIDAGTVFSPVLFKSSTLELGTPTSQDVVFSNNVGTLIIDDPASFTGTIAPSSLFNTHSTGDVVILKGLSLVGLQGHSYEGNSTAGVLSLHYSSGTTNLNIVGDFNAGSFNFSAGPQFLTTSPPSLQITIGGTVKLLNDTGPSSTDYITFDPTITQKAYPNAAVQLVVDGTPLANYIHANTSGVWTYTPVGLADGAHTIVASEFTGGYRASTVTLGTASITFTLDTKLVAYDDAYVALSGQALSIAANTGVLINDVTPAPAIVSLATGPTHGALQLGSDGSFFYRPVDGFAGIDAFSYRVTTEKGDAAEAQATIYALPINVGQTTTLDLANLTAEQQIAATYIAFFGRGADAAGFEFWVNEFAKGAGHQIPATLFANIASSFGVSGEAKGLYPFLEHPAEANDTQIRAFLEGVYDNLFNRSSDPAGLAYWTDQIKQTLAKGEFVGSVLVDIMSGAQNSPAGQDIVTLMGKVAVGLEYVHQQEQHNMVWGGAVDVAAAAALLQTVTADPLSVLIGIQSADALVGMHA